MSYALGYPMRQHARPWGTVGRQRPAAKPISQRFQTVAMIPIVRAGRIIPVIRSCKACSRNASTQISLSQFVPRSRISHFTMFIFYRIANFHRTVQRSSGVL